MNKISEKFKSVRVKLFFTLSIIVILIIALLIIMNSIVLETFYTVSKISAVKKEYNIINDLYNIGDPSVLNQIALFPQLAAKFLYMGVNGSGVAKIIVIPYII